MPQRTNRKIYFVPDGYEVTEDGKVFSCKSNWRGLGRREMAQFDNSYGYKVVHLTHKGKKMRRPVHLLVAYKFLPPKPSTMHQIRHLDGDKANNAASNLKWGTALENAEDRAKHGRTYHGEKHYSSKLTDAQRLEIIYDTELNQRQLAEKYNVTQLTISYTRKMAVPVLITENLQLKANLHILAEALEELMRFECSFTPMMEDILQHPESFLKAVTKAKEALNKIS